MKVLGIIAEYNPFHNGHKYHLDQSIKQLSPDYTVCVMSGNFTQRGEPAMADKWLRSKAAVKSGIDLVLELPFAFACNNAEFFAAGAVDILNRIGCVSHLSFGSEAGELAALNRAADFLYFETEELKESIKKFSGEGISFPKARYEAVKKCAGEECAEALKTPNNILAVEYLKQLKLTGSNINPHTIKRFGTDYNELKTAGNIASATAIRHKINQNAGINHISEFLPPQSYEVLKNIDIGVNNKLNDFYQVLAYSILLKDAKSIGSILSATEGLENRLKKSLTESVDTTSMIKAIISKRYTATRIQRLLIHNLLNLDKESFGKIINEKINYARVLAFNNKGAKLLKHIKNNETNTIPLLTNINRELDNFSKEWLLLNYDIAASDIYNLVTRHETYTHSDYVIKPFKDFI